MAVEADPSVVRDPLAVTPVASSSRESLGLKAAWAQIEQARVDFAVGDDLSQTWSPLSLFTSSSHQVNTENQSARLGLTLQPISTVDLSVTGSAARNFVRDTVIDDAASPLPSLFNTETQDAVAGLKWRPTSWFTLNARGRVEATNAQWHGAPSSGAGLADARVDYADFEPQITGMVALPWSDKLGLSFEHAVSPVDPHAFSSFASVENRDASARFGPGREWRYRLTFDQELAGALKLSAAVTQAQIESATELGPVGAGLQAPVSVTGGARQEVDLQLSAPLEAIGLPSVMLQGTGAWRDSQVRDPFTGAFRRASAEVPQNATLGIVQTLTGHRARWGLEGHFGGDQTLYQMSQVTQVRVSNSIGGFVEYLPGPFAVRLQVDGLYGGDRSSTDIQFSEPRSFGPLDPVDRIDHRTDGGEAVRLILRKTL